MPPKAVKTPDKSPGRFRIDLPFTPAKTTGAPIIRVRFPDGKEGRFMLTTGPSSMLVTARLVTRLHLTRKHVVDADGKLLKIQGQTYDQVTIPSMNIGIQPLVNWDFLVLEEAVDTFSTQVDTEPIDGVLSASFFTLFGVIFDFPHHRISIWPDGNVTVAEQRAAGLTDPTTAPLMINSSLQILVPVSFNADQKGMMIVNTGAASTLITPTVAAALKLAPTRTGADYSLATGSLKVDVARLDTLAIGTLPMRPTQVAYATDPKATYDPMLCLDMLSPYMLLVDLPAKKLALQLTDPHVLDGQSVTFLSGRNGSPLVEVRLNDKVTGTFVVDTGFSISSISNEMAARLGLQGTPVLTADKKPLIDPFGKETKTVLVTKMDVGSLSLDQNQLALMDTAPLTMMCGRPVDGVLGVNFCSSGAMLFDFEKHRLAFWPGGRLSAQQRKYLGFENAYSAPLVAPDPERYYSVHVKVNDKSECDLVLDTGANISDLPQMVAKGLSSTLIYDQPYHTLVGDPLRHLARFDSLQIGTYTMKQPLIGYIDAEDEHVPPMLGLDILAQFRVLVDFPDRKIYFTPVVRRVVSLPLKDFGSNRFPLFEVQLRDGKNWLMGISPASPSSLDSNAVKEWPSAAIQKATPESNDLPVATTSLQLSAKTSLLPDTDFLVQSLDAFRARVPNMIGWLGVGLLTDYAVQLDVGAGQMALIAPGNLADTPLIKDYPLHLPMLLTKGGYVVDLPVDGKPVRFVLDLMTDHSWLGSKEVAGGLHPRVSNTLVRQDGSTRRYMRLKELDVAGAKLPDPLLVERSDAEAPNFNHLGSEFFTHFRAILDFRGSTLYLAPTAHATDRATDESGVGIEPNITQEGRIFVNGLYTPSSAKEAGMEIGDEIVEVNGITVKKDSIPNIVALFKSQSTFNITYKHKDKPDLLKAKLTKGKLY